MITNNGVGIVTDKPLPARREFDHYATDEGTVRRVLCWTRSLQGCWPRSPVPTSVLDAGAGDGIWGTVLREYLPEAQLHGVEVRPSLPIPKDYDLWFERDFTRPHIWLPKNYDLIIGNPPYRHAEEFVRNGLALLREGGMMVFLLRLAFLEGQKRRDGLFDEFPPRAVGVCSKRPSFTGDGRTNATAFAAFVWQKGWRGTAELHWLGGNA